MAIPQRSVIDMQGLEIRNLVDHLLTADPGSPVEGQVYYNTVTHAPRFWNGTVWVQGGRLDQITAPNGDVSFNSHKGTNVTDPTNPQDIATKAYVDAQAAGIRTTKDSVRLVTAAALAAYTRVSNVITANANGAIATIDGVAPAVNDRILLKNGAAGADNGIYVVTQLGSGGTPFILTRSGDAATSADVLEGMFAWADEGTANGSSGWLLTTTGAIVLNTTSLAFTQISSATTITAGNGLNKTGSSIAVVPGAGILADGTSTRIDPSVVSQRYSADVGDGATTSIVVTHNLGTRDVDVTVFSNSTPWAEVGVEVQHTSINTITLVFAVAPTSAQFRCTIRT